MTLGAALAEMQAEDAELAIEAIELGVSAENNQRFRDAIAAFGISRPAVPLVVIGGGYELGFGRRTQARYVEMIDACRAGACPDVLGGEAPTLGTETPAGDAGTVSLPWIGELRLSALSLPVLTVVLAAVDGFNPCAMWVFALLIAFLLGV